MQRNSQASWIGSGHPSERPLPSWMAPPPPAAASVTRWTARPSQAPPPDRFSISPTVGDIKFTAAPRIDIPEIDEELLPRPERVPSVPPPPREPPPELIQLLDDLRAAIEGTRRATLALRREALETTERDLVKLALEIARRVVAREVEVDPRLVTAWAREGIDALASEDRVVVSLSPEVVEALETSGERQSLETLADVVADPRMKRGDCEVRGKLGRVDEGVRSRMNAVIAALDLDSYEEDGAP